LGNFLEDVGVFGGGIEDPVKGERVCFGRDCA
jgi:hypothetical protein